MSGGGTHTDQDDWVLDLYRAMQAAIGQLLEIKYEPPGELTPELAVVLKSLEETRPPSTDERSLEDRTEVIPRPPPDAHPSFRP